MVARSSYASGVEINPRVTGTYFRGMFFTLPLIKEEQVVSLLAKELTLNTGKLPPGGFSLARQEQCG